MEGPLLINAPPLRNGLGFISLLVLCVQMNLLHVELVENAVLCGARFMDSGGSRFAVSAYDNHEIQTFIRKSTPV